MSAYANEIEFSFACHVLLKVVPISLLLSTPLCSCSDCDYSHQEIKDLLYSIIPRAINQQIDKSSLIYHNSVRRDDQSYMTITHTHINDSKSHCLRGIRWFCVYAVCGSVVLWVETLCLSLSQNTGALKSVPVSQTLPTWQFRQL